jgi:peptidoglycan/LPS O-acetylase OafA/YrhL
VKNLGEALDSRHNSVNAIRLAFAGSIIVLHATVLGGYMSEMPTFIFQDSLGTYALAGFFVISGYMITASRLSSRSFHDYLWRRLVRLYPAWIASFVLVAVVLGPLSLVLQGRDVSGYDWSSAWGYVYKNLLFILQQVNVEGTIQSVPYPNVWNFSAWTVFYEFTLWMAIGVGVLIVPKRLLKPALIAGFLAFTAFKVVDKLVVGPSQSSTNAGGPGEPVEPGLWAMIEPLARLGIFFLAGALLYMYRDQVRLSRAVLWICLAVSAALAVLGYFHVFAALPWGYAIMYAGTSKRFARVNYPNDYSYGTYIYAYPITQIWALVNLDHPMPFWFFATLCVVTTAPIAWASWHALEKPAMSLKRLTAGRDKAIIGVP